MCSPADGRHVVRAMNGLEGPVRAELATLWLDYAEGLALGGHVGTARLFAELSVLAAVGTTEADRVDAAFIDLVARMKATPATGT